MPKLKKLRFSHALDAAWIIALWKAIHGGDPSPIQIAVEAIAALSGTLTNQSEGAISESSIVELQTRLKEIGVELHVDTKAGKKVTASAQPRTIRNYCIIFQGQRICIPLPTPFPHPLA